MNDDDHLLIGRFNGIAYRRENKTENYVRVPPALMITDSDGAVWSFGPHYNPATGEINVLRNDVDTGEWASYIEYQRGIVTLYGVDGIRKFSRNRRHII